MTASNHRISADFDSGANLTSDEYINDNGVKLYVATMHGNSGSVATRTLRGFGRTREEAIMNVANLREQATLAGTSR